MLEKIAENWKALSVIGAILLAGSSAGVWAYDIDSKVQSIANRVDSRDFRTLEELRQARGLTFNEWVQWCQLRQQFGGQKCDRFIPDPRTGRMK